MFSSGKTDIQTLKREFKVGVGEIKRTELCGSEFSLDELLNFAVIERTKLTVGEITDVLKCKNQYSNLYELTYAPRCSTLRDKITKLVVDESEALETTVDEFASFKNGISHFGAPNKKIGFQPIDA